MKGEQNTYPDLA